MHFEQTWRWFGPYDTISLEEIRQTGATGIVTALHHIPVGDVWTVDEINKRKAAIEEAGLVWSVVESVPVHEDIKRQVDGYERYLDNYKQSVTNLGACGIQTLCYNFMPVLDWTRTDLAWKMPDGSTALRFDRVAFAAFDLFILDRAEAAGEYSDGEKKRAKTYFDTLDEAEKAELTKTVLTGLPGSEEGYPLEEFRRIIKTYKDISEDDLRTHLYEFLREVTPVAEKAGVRLAIHPDDPPFSLLGLPRVVSTEEDARRLLDAADSPSNGLTFCTGSFGAREDNDLTGMVDRLGDRIHFVHFRSVQREESERSFYEADHLAGSAGIVGVMTAVLREMDRREKEGRSDVNIPMRPDHGHAMLDDLDKETFPGYSCIGRLRGLAELRGLELGLRQGMIREQE